MDKLLEYISDHKKEVDIKEFKTHYLIDYSHVSSKLMKKTSDKPSLVLSNDNNDFDFYDKLNRYCIEKDPSYVHILKKLIKYIDEKKVSIDDFDIAYHKLKTKLSSMKSTSKPYELSTTSKTIYDIDCVFNIIINEFLECHNWGSRFGIKLDTIDNNLFNWSVKMTLGKIIVDIEIQFTEMYPNYPPIVNIKTLLKKSLNHRISNSKMIQLAYWTPTRNMNYILKKIKTILDKFGKTDNDISFPALENILSKLSSFIDSVNDDEIDDEEYIKYEFQTEKKESDEGKSIQTSFKKGTGYGGNYNKSSWNPSKYVKLQKEKDTKLNTLINELNTFLGENLSGNEELIFKTIKKSLLIPHLIQQFNGITLLDIVNRNGLFSSYISLIKLLCHDETIELFSTEYNGLKLHDILHNLNEPLKLSDSKDENLKSLKNILAKSFNKPVKLKKEEKSDDVKILYQQQMSKLAFKTEENLASTYFFKSELKSGTWTKCNKRLSIELPSLANNQLPINFDASIFLTIDEDSHMAMRALITGPKDTPYDSGFFIFDILTPTTYPTTNPKVQFMNHNGVRFNPNLYASGYVCLSLLGTWSGIGGEKWNPETSNLLQLLVSLQSQILVEEPYYNEPGHEKIVRTQASKKYNEEIRLYTMKYAILSFLENPKIYPQFEEMVKIHFKLKKDHIKTTIHTWLKECSIGFNKSKMKNVVEEIEEKLDSI